MIVIAALAAAAALSHPGPVRGAPALALFDLLKSLSGDWVGKSTKGWVEAASFQVLAGGTAVLETTRFTSPPEPGMATVFHLDGDRVLLTHYCEAGNHPRLQATAFDPVARTATFSFLDGTGMASRDVGHMDAVLIRFIDADHFDSQWTWYQMGAERWLEKISYQRGGSDAKGKQ